MKPNVYIFSVLFCWCFFGFATAQQLIAEDIYSRVHAILQTHCTTGCHTTGTPSGMLVLAGDANTVYNNLVGTTPTNPAAQTKGYKRVEAGRPDLSYLFKKINLGLEHNFDLEQAEGGSMPPYGGLPLSNVEKETIRQWILFGAPQIGEVVSEQTLNDFYASGIPFLTAPPAPAPEDGFQVHHGPIFLQPGQEIEAFRKYALDLADSLDVIGFDITMNAESHHFVVYQYDQDADFTDLEKGVRMSSGFMEEIFMYENAEFLDIWQFGEPHMLPQNTAFRWGHNTNIDFNYHIKNYSNINIIPAEAYINFYTRPKDLMRKEMKLQIASYGENNPFLLNVPNTGQDVTFSFPQNWDEDRWVRIWKLQGHTHQLGRDFDVYTRNADGTRGEQIYEGYMNTDHQFNQGYYDYAHPPVLRLEETPCLNLKNGLIFEARYNNTGPSNVGFGLTTDKEMFAAYYHYYELSADEVGQCSEVLGTNNEVLSATSHLGAQVYPNPAANTARIDYQVPQNTMLDIQLLDINGRHLQTLYQGNRPTGQYSQPIAIDNLANGLYLVQISTQQSTITRQLVVER